MTPVCCRGSQGPEAVISLSLPALHFHSCGGVKGEFGTLEDIRPTLEGLSGRTLWEIKPKHPQKQPDASS